MQTNSFRIFFLACVSLISTAFAQNVGGGYDLKDSSLIPSKRMPQHTEFLNGTYNFPSKPRNQWEIGVKGGLFQISGDVHAQFLSPGFGLHVRKAFGYVFSLRGEFMNGVGKGYAYTASGNYGKNPAWGRNIANPNQRYSAPLAQPGPGGAIVVGSSTGQPGRPWEQVFYNYKTNVQELSLQGVITLNNVRFHKSKTGMNLYIIGGMGAMIYETYVNALNGTQKYNFQALASAPYKERRSFLKNMLNNVLDDDYETPAEDHGTTRPKIGGKTLRPVAIVGMGVAFKLNNRLNLAIEDRMSIVRDDLLDGQRWQENPWGDAALTRDFDSYNYLTVGLNINLGGRSVEPLWWINPLDYAYGEIRNPRLMKFPKPVLPDTDGDGVTDQFDREQTPAGCPVDSHGVSLDTDGDGVPDCKDKELITPTYCQQNVDADGVGKCPCPDDCKSLIPPPSTTPTCAASMGSLPSISFKAGTNDLTDDAKLALSTAAVAIRNNPSCKVVVIGYCATSKKEQQMSWDHVNIVINYLVDKEGINIDRFIFSYGQLGGDCNTVDLRAAGEGESGPNRVEPPHPNLRKN
jgi:hypothetical protein